MTPAAIKPYAERYADGESIGSLAADGETASNGPP